MENNTPYIRHIAGAFENLKQHCVICGFELCNYENAIWPNGQSAPGGFNEGPIYVMKNGGCTSFYAMAPAPEQEIINCKP